MIKALYHAALFRGDPPPNSTCEDSCPVCFENYCEENTTPTLNETSSTEGNGKRKRQLNETASTSSDANDCRTRMVLQCNHCICVRCRLEILKNPNPLCPICRSPFAREVLARDTYDHIPYSMLQNSEITQFSPSDSNYSLTLTRTNELIELNDSQDISYDETRPLNVFITNPQEVSRITTIPQLLNINFYIEMYTKHNPTNVKVYFEYHNVYRFISSDILIDKFIEMLSYRRYRMLKNARYLQSFTEIIGRLLLSGILTEEMCLEIPSLNVLTTMSENDVDTYKESVRLYLTALSKFQHLGFGKDFTLKLKLKCNMLDGLCDYELHKHLFMYMLDNMKRFNYIVTFNFSMLTYFNMSELFKYIKDKISKAFRFLQSNNNHRQESEITEIRFKFAPFSDNQVVLIAEKVKHTALRSFLTSFGRISS